MAAKQAEAPRHESVDRERRPRIRSIPNLSIDDFFEASTIISAGVIVLVVIVASVLLAGGSAPVLQRFGLGFFSGTNWISDPGSESFGVLPYILGTLVTSAIAIAVGVPLSLGVAIFLAEMAPWSVRNPFSRIIELLAAVPSIIYGFWGLIVFRFWIRDFIERPISGVAGQIPVFRGTPLGLDILTAGLILAIMIIPTVASISKDVMTAVPSSQREAAYSIGATRWEVVRTAVLGYSRSGIFGAIILGLGRALGETMAVTMIIGNQSGPQAIPTSLFQTGATMASVIANDFGEAIIEPLHLSALLGIGLTLLLIAVAINAFAQFMVWKVLKVKSGPVE